MQKLAEIFAQLGLNESNGLFLTKDDTWKSETAFPNRVQRLLDRKINPDAFFCFDNKPILLFFESPANKDELHRAIWNFNECPVAIITDGLDVEVFNGFNYLKEQASLEKFGGAEILSKFNYFELVTGRTWEEYQDKLSYRNRVDYHLLNNIKAARKSLVNTHQLDGKVANAIIGKVIFIRYLIDRKVKMKFDDKLRTWTNAEFCELFDDPEKIKNFFDYIEDNEKGFNGDLFPLSEAEYALVKEAPYQVLKRLLLGDDIEVNQQSLFELYDFSIIPIEFISNVYELFIGQDNQKKEGAYYTPLFLVDYILKETVEDHLMHIKQTDLAIDTLLGKTDYAICRVLDPACGSGIFLVETLRKIIEKYIIETDSDIKSKSFKTAIKDIAQENIYGIDKDLSAIQVAVFSIYLTLLDYLDPPGIETFKFPQLLNKNFFEADFFASDLAYNETLKSVSFDFILGNPPWKGNGMDDTGKKYLKARAKKEKPHRRQFPIAINNNEIAEGFILRASDFCSADTRVSFIVRSSILYNMGYNDGYSPFRQYWLQEYLVDKIFELAPVRHEVFEKSNQPAVAPAVVIFYRYANGEKTDSNLLEHFSLKQSRFFSLFKIFTINRTDYKRVEQRKLKEDDMLWKVLVYGSYLDFNFVKRLKNKYESIRKLLSDKNKFVEATGIHSRTKPLEVPKDTSEIEGISFIKTDALKPFFIDYEKVDKLEPEKIDIIKDIRIYKPPMLLIREGIDMGSLTAKCAIADRELLFKDSITSIKVLDRNDQSILKNIAAIFASDIFSYYAVNVFASIGIERERVKNYNKYGLPYVDVDAGPYVDQIEQAYADIYNKEKKLMHDPYAIEELNASVSGGLQGINELLVEALELDPIEKALIDYALKVNKTLIVGSDKERTALFSVVKFKDSLLKQYADIFIERFKDQLETPHHKFVVEIWHSNEMVGMFFKLLPVADFSEPITWLNKQNEDHNVLALLTKISTQKVTDKLFVQKDIRGFEQDYFYIFKPNESRLWYPALAYLDVNEFADSILKAGRPHHVS